MSKFLNELEASKLLSENGIPMVKSYLCTSKEEANDCIDNMNFPVVMKILSSDILHKTEAGCVFTGINSKEDVIEIYNKIIQNAQNYNPNCSINGVLIQEMAQKGLEIIVGVNNDPQFGPVLVVGTGGIYVEVYKDISMRLLPIKRKDAEDMIKETKIYEIITGARGTKYDYDFLVDFLLRVSQLIMSNSYIEELDINPLFLYELGNGAKGVDALVKISSIKGE